MHFAAYAYVGESVEDPLLYYQNNVAASAALLQTLLSFETIPVVFSSTCATYGAPETIPISEDHPQRPINPYGYSKLVVERMLADLDAARGLRSISLRYFNAAGADPDGEIGEAHDPETHLIPLVLAAARDGKPVTVFGDDYDTPDGTCIRDYIHVLDIAEAHIRALDLADQPGMQSFNIGTGTGYSVRQICDAVTAATGRTVRIRIAQRRPGDPPVLCAS